MRETLQEQVGFAPWFLCVGSEGSCSTRGFPGTRLSQGTKAPQCPGAAAPEDSSASSTCSISWSQNSVARSFPLYQLSPFCTRVPPVRHLSVDFLAPERTHFRQVSKGGLSESSARAAPQRLLSHLVSQGHALSKEVWISAWGVCVSSGRSITP